MREEMMLVFNHAIDKAESRIRKPGNTATPWDDLPNAWLKKRLWDEIFEWKESQSPKELIDIINIAAFLYYRQCVVEKATSPKGTNKSKEDYI